MFGKVLDIIRCEVDLKGVQERLGACPDEWKPQSGPVR